MICIKVEICFDFSSLDMRVHILEIWNQYIITYFTIEIRIQEGFGPIVYLA